MVCPQTPVRGFLLWQSMPIPQQEQSILAATPIDSKVKCAVWGAARGEERDPSAVWGAARG